MVANTSWLPHPDTVYALGRAAFPTARARRGHPRFTFICDNGKRVGMYDDNTTPRWAILGAHGIRNWRDRKGWAFAHVWPSPASDNINSFSHLANLVMIPECFASLTDKNCLLTGYLRWHAKTVYGWKPDDEEPQMPVGPGPSPFRTMPFLPPRAPRIPCHTLSDKGQKPGGRELAARANRCRQLDIQAVRDQW